MQFLPTTEASRAPLLNGPDVSHKRDNDLIDDYLAGDETAFSELVARHANLVYGTCFRLLQSKTDAEDAFQTTFIVLAQRARSLQWSESVAGWLHQTARRTALGLRSRMARRQYHTRVAGDLAQSPAAPPEPYNQLALRELTEALEAELDSLPTRFREAILLCQVEGLSRDDAATRLGISVAAVKDRLERGREQLRKNLAARGITITAVAIAGWLTPSTTHAAALSLINSTTQVASAIATSPIASGAIHGAFSIGSGILNACAMSKLKSPLIVLLSLLTAGTVAFGMLKDNPNRFHEGLRGTIVSVEHQTSPTITILLDEYDSLLTLDVSQRAEVWVAFEQGKLSDLKGGQYVSVRLAGDHRTVSDIHVQGMTREVIVEAVDPAGQTMNVVYGDDDDDQSSVEVRLKPDAILRVGGLPATLADVTPGMEVPLEFGLDGNLVNAIEVEAQEGLLIEGFSLPGNAPESELLLQLEDEEGAPPHQAFEVTEDTIITLDDQPARLPDIPINSRVRLRLSLDRTVVRAIQAVRPTDADAVNE